MALPAGPEFSDSASSRPRSLSRRSFFATLGSAGLLVILGGVIRAEGGSIKDPEKLRNPLASEPNKRPAQSLSQTAAVEATPRISTSHSNIQACVESGGVYIKVTDAHALLAEACLDSSSDAAARKAWINGKVPATTDPHTVTVEIYGPDKGTGGVVNLANLPK